MPSPVNSSLKQIYFVNDSTGWAGGDSGIIIHTSNGGQSWQIQENRPETQVVDIFFLDENTGWALSWNLINPFGTFIHRTTNGGSNWNREPYPEPNKFFKSIYFLDSLNGWMGGGGFVGTKDGGFEWNPVQIDSGLLSQFPVLNFSFYSPKYGYANGGQIDLSGVIWRTTTYGNGWASTPVGPEPIHKLHIFDSLNVIGVGGDFEYGTGIVRTSDGGNNWEYRSLQILGIAFSLAFRTPTEGWAPLGIAEKFLITTDAGFTWSAIATPNETSIFDLTFTDSLHGYAAGKDGIILKYTHDAVGINNDNNFGLPSKPKLFQNYPNPFNRSTQIAYSIPQPSFVTLTVFDVMGREIETLINGQKKPGEYTVSFTSKDLSTGIYYYKLTTRSLINPQDEFTQTRKMILVR